MFLGHGSHFSRNPAQNFELCSVLVFVSKIQTKNFMTSTWSGVIASITPTTAATTSTATPAKVAVLAECTICAESFDPARVPAVVKFDKCCNDICTRCHTLHLKNAADFIGGIKASLFRLGWMFLQHFFLFFLTFLFRFAIVCKVHGAAVHEQVPAYRF